MTAPRSSRQHSGPSVFDVAELAGVSAQTVSRVSNGRTNVNQATREKVQAAMLALGYRPNSAARSLATGRYRSIGFITSTLATYGTMHTLDAIAQAAREAGYTLSLLPLTLPSPGDLEGAASTLVDQNVDGIIVMVETTLLESRAARFPPGVPIVATDAHAGTPYQTVDSNEESGIRAALRHLIDRGHTRIHHVAGPQNSYAAQLRRDLWRTVMLEEGLPTPRVYYGDWTSESGSRIGSMLAGQDDLTAVFSANDQMALGVMTALQRAGRHVPRDVSVVGFDDVTEAASYNPPLTTVRQDFDALGRRAVHQLLDAIGSAEPRRVFEGIPSQLVIRESTGPAAVGRQRGA